MPNRLREGANELLLSFLGTLPGTGKHATTMRDFYTELSNRALQRVLFANQHTDKKEIGNFEKYD